MTIHAQAKYCDNDADFVGNKWKEISDVEIVYKREGNYDYGISFETGNKEADKFLKKSNYYIMWNDTLYINTKRAMQSLGSEAGDGYAKAIVLTDDRFFFLGPPTKSILVVPYGGGAIGGAIGGAMSAYRQFPCNRHRLYEKTDEKLTRFMEAIQERKKKSETRPRSH